MMFQYNTVESIWVEYSSSLRELWFILWEYARELSLPVFYNIFVTKTS